MTPTRDEVETHLRGAFAELAAATTIRPDAQARFEQGLLATRRRRRMTVAAALTTAAAVAATALLVDLPFAKRSAGPAHGTKGQHGARVVASVPFGYGKSLAVGFGSVWIAGTLSPLPSPFWRIWRVDPRTHRLVDIPMTIPPSGALGGIAAGAGGVWVTDFIRGLLFRLDPGTGREVYRARLAGAEAVAVGAGSVWVTSRYSGAVYRVDPGTGRILAEVRVGPAGTARNMAASDAAVWVTEEGAVSRIDPRTNRVVATLHLPNCCGESRVAIAPDAIWLTDTRQDRLVRIDPASNRIVAGIRVCSRPQGLAAVKAGVWVACVGDQESGKPDVALVDPGRRAVVANLPIKLNPNFYPPRSAVAAGDGVWVADGGYLRLVVAEPAGR